MSPLRWCGPCGKAHGAIALAGGDLEKSASQPKGARKVRWDDDDELETLQNLTEKYGTKWGKIAKELGTGRTANSISKYCKRSPNRRRAMAPPTVWQLSRQRLPRRRLPRRRRPSLWSLHRLQSPGPPLPPPPGPPGPPWHAQAPVPVVNMDELFDLKAEKVLASAADETAAHAAEVAALGGGDAGDDIKLERADSAAEVVSQLRDRLKEERRDEADDATASAREKAAVKWLELATS
eukprot:COSAG06_NODE_10888_length_1601_cov_1.083888_2_plen_237_part_00